MTWSRKLLAGLVVFFGSSLIHGTPSSGEYPPVFTFRSGTPARVDYLRKPHDTLRVEEGEA